jgi:hypothetical protein
MLIEIAMTFGIALRSEISTAMGDLNQVLECATV